jgi:16S rRNA (cytidine1402-2'-O)-methyltransferase
MDGREDARGRVSETGFRAASMPGTLYVVSLPIGNLSDITLRAIDVLRSVDCIVAEDTRTTRRLLTRHSIATPTYSSYYQGVELQRVGAVLSQLESGKSVALVSDAGTPLINDPGFPLIRAAIEYSFPVVPVPGPSALLTALVVSGLPTDRFCFEGAVPRTAGGRRDFADRLQNELRTCVVYESPHRLVDTLSLLAERIPKRRIALARELTKLHEEVLRGLPEEVLQVLVERGPVRGECVLVIEGCGNAVDSNQEAAEQLASFLEARGLSKHDIRAALTLAFGLSRNEIYRLVHQRQETRRP